MQSVFRFLATALVFSAAVLAAGCQTTLAHYRDCKSGDWQVIGNKDGDQGLEAQYEERRKFCSSVDSDKIKPDSGAAYQTGWQQGNDSFWSRLGKTDGLAALPVTNFQNQTAIETIKENKTPLNPTSYQKGWALGNGEYWRKAGVLDGYAGLSAKVESQRMQEGKNFGFNASSYTEGWREGNLGYWTSLGYIDAHAGISDAVFPTHARAAQDANVLVREEAYRAAWKLEILEYWKRTAWDDATHGRDLAMRRVEAKNRQLTVPEAVYQERWEARLVEYWHDIGMEDGFGHPFQLGARMAGAPSTGVFVIAATRDVYSQAWTQENDRYCDVNRAFELGRKNAYFAHEVCRGVQEDYTRRAWAGGRAYEEVSDRQSHLQSELADTRHKRNEMAERLDRMVLPAAETTSGSTPEAEKARHAERDRRAEQQKQLDRERQAFREEIWRVDARVDELVRRDKRLDSERWKIQSDLRGIGVR
jgi:hypothetical protein